VIPSILLSAIVFVSAIACLVIVVLPERNDEDRGRVRTLALFASGVQLFLTLFFAVGVQIGLGAGGGVSSANEENHPWFSSFSFSSAYHLTADGISLVLLVLSTVMFFCVFFQAWRVPEPVRLYVGLLLLLETAVNGVLCASDYVLFLLFWGLMIVPIYVLLRVWGGRQRARAAGNYLLFALTSLALLTLAVLLVIVRAGLHTSDLSSDSQQALTGPVASAGFWLALTAFGIALGAFPFHRWLIDAHSEASPGVGALLIGVVSKLGAYGILRIAIAQFPTAAHQYTLLIVGFAVVGAIWGGLAALAQGDLRRFIGYSNVAQIAVILLAAGTQTSVALVGVVLFMLAQGLSSGMLVLLSGVLEERVRTRSIAGLGGLVTATPRLAAFWWIAVLTVIGFPVFAGFSANVIVFSGAFPVHRIATVLVLASLVLTAAGLVRTAHRVFFGPLRETLQRVRDVGLLELSYLMPIVAIIVLAGVRPGALTPVITNGVIQITARLSGGG
jgi:NADH-quinone oxidoreductase subunit M